MYQIGEFSKICQVSVKTLRHYDSIGLLKPVEVDRFTGYRYYDREQLGKMLLIQRLKRYEFSLEEIQRLLENGNSEEMYRALSAQKEKLMGRQMELGVAIQDLTLHLRKLKETGDVTIMDNERTIQLKETKRLAVLAVREKMGVDDFGRYYGTLYRRVAKVGGLRPTAVVGAKYHDEEFNRDSSDVELFIGVEPESKADQVWEPQLCAVTVHKGPYSTLPEAYAALVRWIEENGLSWNGAPYEIYTKTAQNGFAPQDWETEIYFPVKKA